MFGIGMYEIVIVFVLALMIFGPRRLPEIGKYFGKATRMFNEASKEIRKSLSEVQTEITKDMYEVQKTKDELKKTLLEGLPSQPSLPEPDVRSSSLPQKGDPNSEEGSSGSPPTPTLPG